MAAPCRLAPHLNINGMILVTRRRFFFLTTHPPPQKFPLENAHHCPPPQFPLSTPVTHADVFLRGRRLTQVAQIHRTPRKTRTRPFATRPPGPSRAPNTIHKRHKKLAKSKRKRLVKLESIKVSKIPKLGAWGPDWGPPLPQFY